MTEDEYKEKIREIDSRANIEKIKVYKKYALSNNTYKVGDIITDHIGSGIVTGWKPHYGYLNKLPSLVYECQNLTASGKVSKREPIRNIYQTNLKG